MIRKKEGFEGQKAIVLPKPIRETCKNDPVLSSLYVTDIGCYPRAQHHFRERDKGISQHVLIYCVEGKGWVEIEGKRMSVNPNEYLIIPAWLPHRYAAEEDYPWSIYWMHFKGNHVPVLDHILSRKTKNYVHHCSYSDHRLSIFEDIYAALESGYSMDNLYFAGASLQYFLISLIYPEKLSVVGTKEQKNDVDLSIEYMKENVHQALTLDQIASSVHLSVSHFSNLFKKSTGYSPVVYFNHLKIQRASQYLEFTDWRINQIAHKVGMEDPYYFSRLFTKVMGISPKEYRSKKQFEVEGFEG